MVVFFRPGGDNNEQTALSPKTYSEQDTTDEIAVPASDSTVADYDVYEVQKRATLSVIAMAYGVTVDDIKKANDLKGDVLQAGQTLIIPKK